MDFSYIPVVFLFFLQNVFIGGQYFGYSQPSYPTGYSQNSAPSYGSASLSGSGTPALTLNLVNSVSYQSSPVASDECKSTTYRTNLGCYCRLFGKRCAVDNTICVANYFGDGYCECREGFVAYKQRCLTRQQYDQQHNATSNSPRQPFLISGPIVTVSCFLRINSPVATIEKLGPSDGVTFTYSWKLLSSSPLGDTNRYIEFEPATGTLMYKVVAPVALLSQRYQLTATPSKGPSANRTYTIAFNCTAPTCSFDFGNALIVDCLRYTIGDTILRLQVNSTIEPTIFSMSLINSSSRNGNMFFRIDAKTGQILLQKMPHGGVFVENYSVAATNAAGVSCPAQTLTLTTTETCI